MEDAVERLYHLSPPAPFPDVATSLYGFAVADVIGDGRPEIAVASDGRLRLYESQDNSAAGRWTWPSGTSGATADCGSSRSPARASSCHLDSRQRGREVIPRFHVHGHCRRVLKHLTTT